ncbi:hypothetical protein CPB83DRAFT_911201 [Crepidotus variabilis]|uniref:Uncharacterized protein n=1 Tax=Crepidotus variabilis TaxID=179855 RepID=A0A9P6JIW2_9AGAR|nr:hypothetical protein CPB83DRAFT_911201 [Crepidotus variabilis]
MSSLPDYVLAILLASTFVSSIIVIFGSMCLSVSLILWAIPASIFLTLVHHLTTFLIRGLQKSNMPRIYTLASIIFTFVIAILWLACLAISATIMALLFCGRVHAKDDQPKVVLGLLSGLCLLEVILMAFLAIRGVRERKQIQYTEKWTWRTPQGGFSQANGESLLTFASKPILPMFRKA